MQGSSTVGIEKLLDFHPEPFMNLFSFGKTSDPFKV